MQLPKTWNEITAKQYSFIVNDDDFLRQVAVLGGLSFFDEKLMTLKMSDIRAIKKTLSFMNELPAVADEVVEVDGIIYNKKNINTISVWEYRDFDFYAKDWKNNIRELIRLLYGDREKDDPAKFDNFPMSCFPLNEWFYFKKMCFEKYPIGGNKEVEEDKSSEDFDNYIDYANYLDELEKQRINRAFNWDKIMLSICNNSPLEAYKSQSLEVLYIFRIISILNLEK